VLTEQQRRPSERERRLGDLQSAHARDAAKRHRVVPGEKSEHHRDHADIAQPGRCAEGDVLGRIADQVQCCHRNGDRQREDDGPADHPPAAVRPGHRTAFGISETGDRDRDQQQQIGRAKLAATLDDREPDNDSQAEGQGRPVRAPRALPSPPDGNARGSGWDQAGEHGPVHAVDVAEGQGREQAESDADRAGDDEHARDGGAWRQQRLAAQREHGQRDRTADDRAAYAHRDRAERRLSRLGGGKGHAEAGDPEAPEREGSRLPSDNRSASITSHE